VGGITITTCTRWNVGAVDILGNRDVSVADGINASLIFNFYFFNKMPLQSLGSRDGTNLQMQLRQIEQQIYDYLYDIFVQVFCISSKIERI
jgi:hypothetical protein